MTAWLNADMVAERLCVSRRTALTLMNQMQHSVIGGTVRKRIRVSEDSLEAWMAKRSAGTVTVSNRNTGSNKRLERRR